MISITMVDILFWDLYKIPKPDKHPLYNRTKVCYNVDNIIGGVERI
jgi:hypothetical protein